MWNLGSDGASCTHDGARFSIAYLPNRQRPTSFRLMIYRKGRQLLNEGGFTSMDAVLRRANEAADDPAIMHPEGGQA
jgi:hypothetical protein